MLSGSTIASVTTPIHFAMTSNYLCVMCSRGLDLLLTFLSNAESSTNTRPSFMARLWCTWTVLDWVLVCQTMMQVQLATRPRSIYYIKSPRFVNLWMPLGSKMNLKIYRNLLSIQVIHLEFALLLYQRAITLFQQTHSFIWQPPQLAWICGVF